MILAGEIRRTRRDTSPSATLSTTNSTWTDLDTNLELRGEKPATNCLMYGTARSRMILPVSRMQERNALPVGWPVLLLRASSIAYGLCITFLRSINLEKEHPSDGQRSRLSYPENQWMSRRDEGYGGQASDDIPRMYRITTLADRFRFCWDGRGMMKTRIRGLPSDILPRIASQVACLTTLYYCLAIISWPWVAVPTLLLLNR
jgi:hypothetical protein